MLISEPTKYGAGIIIYGDYWDLRNLYNTIHELSEGIPLEKNFSEFVLGLAYEIRHAYQKDRGEKTFGVDEYDTVTYRGVSILWPIILSQTGLLRWSASFHPTNREHQANLFRLESCIQAALQSYDSVVGQQCFEWLTLFHGFPDNYLIEFFYERTKAYLFENRHGKSRFKRLPSILKSLTTISGEYQEFSSYLYNLAEEKKCEVNALQDWSAWPNFKW